MTAEIGILNTQGIALAADSAVTIGSSKVFNSADKLFSLSKHHPIGIMIYGNAGFMGVPWETVIKVFRKNLGDTTYDTLDEYISCFFEFLIRDTRFYNKDYEAEMLQRKFMKFLDELLENINDQIPYIFNTGPDESDIQNILFAEAFFYADSYSRLETVNGFDDTYYKVFDSNFSVQIESVLKTRINVDIDTETWERFLIIGACLVMKDIYSDETGVVFAGFGDKEIFPTLKSYSLEGIFNGVLKYKGKHKVEIDVINSATIVPFAQQEMVHSFLTGIDPELKREIVNTIEKITKTYPKVVDEHIININDVQKNGMADFGKTVVDQFVKHINDMIEEKFSAPVVNTVASLPKEELAAMAEALINLTSIKRRMSSQTETVGGPIDVAVISKGDGFIWIKRKHYFSHELNHSYFTNYMER